MQQIKIFKGIENDLSALENEVNSWLRDSNAAVAKIIGNIAPQTLSRNVKSEGLSTGEYCPSDVLLIVLYESA
jgi:hypothetical protein